MTTEKEMYQAFMRQATEPRFTFIREQLTSDDTIRIQTAALTTALKELGRRHDGSKECTQAIKQVRTALEG